uniref:Uncharacterized protein n=1 Tax=Moniliophthora roreri TaxID=221103 RepID=A0A0W0G1A7_MONRR
MYAGAVLYMLEDEEFETALWNKHGQQVFNPKGSTTYKVFFLCY